MNSKKCTKCGEIKALDRFSKCTKHNDGLRYDCRSCQKKQDRIRKDSLKKNFKTINKKQCNVCSKVKRIEHFTKSSRSKDGYISACMVCAKKRKIKYKNQPKKIVIEKACSKCNNIKSIEHFNNMNSSKDGKASSCKECMKKERIKSKLIDKEKNKLYYRQNKSYIKAKTNRYYKDNKAKIIKAGMAYKKKKLKTDPKYYLSYRIRGILYRTFTKSNTTKKSSSYDILGYTNDELYNSLNKGIYKTEDILSSPNKYHIDHIIPLSYFVNKIKDIDDKNEIDLIIKKVNSLENLRIITSKENMMKSDTICIPLINKYKLYHLLV